MTEAMQGRESAAEGDSEAQGAPDLVRLQAVVAETLEIESGELSVDTDLLASGRMDSLAIVSLLAAIEEQYEVVVPIELVVPERFASVRSLQELIVVARARDGA